MANEYYEEKEAIQKEAAKYQALENLTHQEGWKVLVEQLLKLREVTNQDLLKEKDYNRILTLQAQITAFSSVINIIMSAKSIKEKLFENISDIIRDEEFAQEFDLGI